MEVQLVVRLNFKTLYLVIWKYHYHVEIIRLLLKMAGGGNYGRLVCDYCQQVFLETFIIYEIYVLLNNDN